MTSNTTTSLIDYAINKAHNNDEQSRGKYMDTNALYKEWKDKLLQHIGEAICKPCTDPRKQLHTPDYENPLECHCHCERVESILAKAKAMNDDISNNENSQ